MQEIRDLGIGIRSIRWHRTLVLSLMLAVTPAAAQNRPNPTNPNRSNPTNPNPTNPTNRTTPTNPPTPTNPRTEVAVPPIECWWKTDRNAVRVGEHFALTLTC